MKLFILVASLVFSQSVLAKSKASGLSAELLKSVKEDVAKEQSGLRRQGPSRGPASVSETSPTQQAVEEQKANEKLQRNLNQIGKPQW